ncbi:MAG: hypothetical protein P0Y59_15730 [Candidatus Sphingomonas phytovorans]|nr:hypothetical protein [Sphingomonas sp.]WEJ98389.1 MAG: hypothetical protein P0Y59_15730 [Sphingomonas sp.]
MTYKPTAGDIAFRDAAKRAGGLNPFEKTEMLRNVSDTYLVVLASDNATTSKVLFDAELARRGSLIARRANTISIMALGVSVASLVAAVVAIAMSTSS